MSVPAQQMAPYSPVEALQRTSAAMYPEMQQFGVRPAANTPLEGTPPAQAPNASPEQLTFGMTLKAATEKKGHKLTSEEISALQSNYINDHVVPGLWSEKGMNKAKFEALLGTIKNKQNRVLEAYNKQVPDGPVAPEAQSAKSRGLEVAGDTLVGVGGAAASLVPGALGLVDMALRNAPTGHIFNAYENFRDKGLPHSMAELNQYFGTARHTPIGRLAEWMLEQKDNAVEALTSDKTNAQRSDRAQAMKEYEDAGIPMQMAAYVGESLKRPGVMFQDFGTGVGSLVTPAATLKLGTAAKSAPFLEKLVARLIPATAIGAPQAAAAISTAEKQIYDKPLSEITQNPQDKALYQTLLDLGITPAEAERKTKDAIAQRAMPAIVMAEFAANVGTVALVPGAEGALVSRASRPLRNRAVSAALTGAEETGQEGIAQGISQVGQNVSEQQQTGKKVPILRRVGTAVAEGALVGGPVGGIVGGAFPGHPEEPVQTPINTPPPAVAPNAGPTNVPPGTETGPTVEAKPPGKGLAPNDLSVEITKATSDIGQALASSRSGTYKTFAGATSPQEVFDLVSAWVASRKPWAKMDAGQRQDMLEAVGNAVGKKIKQDLTPLLAQAREALAAPAAAPQVTEQPTPPGLLETPPAPAAAAPEAVPTPAPVAPVEVPPTANTAIADHMGAIETILPRANITEEDMQPLAEAMANAKTDPDTLEGVLDNYDFIEGSKTRKLTAAEKDEIRVAAGVAPKKKGLRKTNTAPVATPAPTVEATPTPAPATNETVDNTLPEGLSKAAPRYGLNKLDFKSDIDKALYIVAGEKKSAAHDKYMAWLSGVLKATPEAVKIMAARVKAGVKELGPTGKNGVITVPRISAFSAPNTAPTTVPTAPSKRGLKKPKAETPPKPEAPAQPVAGAQETTSVAPQPTNETSSAANSGERETAETAVGRILEGRLDDESAAELAAAIDLAREGNTSELESILKNGEVHDGDFSFRKYNAAEKIALREAGRSLSPKERGEAANTAPTNEAPYITNETPAQEAERVAKNIKGKTAEQALEWVANNGPSEDYRLIARKVLDRLRQFQKKGALFTFKVRKLPPGESGSATTQVRAKWAGKGGSGMHVLVELSTREGLPTPGTSFQAVLHEFVHSVTAALQLTASHPAFNEFVKGTEAANISKEIADLHKLVLNKLKNIPVGEMTAFEKEMAQGKTNTLQDPLELLAWGLTNRDFQDTLQRIPVGPKQTAWSKFVEIVRKALGLNPDQETALDRILTLGEKLLDSNLDEWVKRVAGESFTGSDALATKSSLFNLEETNKLGNKDKHPLEVTKLQELGEQFTNSTYGLERAEQEARKAGNTVPKDISPYIAGRLYTGHAADIAALDKEEVVDPVANWIANNWRKFADTPESFAANVDLFMQAYHQLHERLPAMWLEQVPLKQGRNVVRAQLIDDANAGTITPEAFWARLNNLVNKYAEHDLAEWSKQSSNSRDVAELQTTLDNLKKKGYDENRLAEFNALLQNVRNRTQEHMLASGRISPTDPWVKARGWKWYVPLKGDPKASETAADMDYGSSAGTTKAFRAKRLELMKGRKSLADSVLEQLIVDMNQEGGKHAERPLKEALFGFVQENLPHMGNTHITQVKGTLKEGFYRDVIVKDKKTGKRRVVQKPVDESTVYGEGNKFGFVHHDGDTHYIVTLDPTNQIAGNLDRGLKGFRNVQSPQGALKALGVATNAIARSYTTWSPTWQLMTGFLRDTNFIPAMVAMDIFDSPLKAGAFWRGYTKRLIGNTVDLGSLKETLSELNGNKKGLRAKAKADPNSFLGQLFAYHEAGGSTEFAQSFNVEGVNDILYGKAKRKGVIRSAKAAYDKVNEWTSNWAQILENKGRVAAWTTLVKDLGYSPEEAASVVKGVMDFGQSGEYGRKLNAWLAFFRVGATSVDAMRRTFTNETGKPDYPKLAKWGSFFSGIAFAGLGLMAMAMGDDDDGVPRISKFDINTLTQKLVIPTGSKPGEVVTYPIGLGLPQLLMAPGTIGFMYSNGYITAKEATNAMYETITRNLPFTPSGWQDGSGAPGFVASWLKGALIPTVAKPLEETSTNINSWDMPIHTPFKDDTRARSEQGQKQTADEWKDMAKELYKITGGTVDMYPEDLKYYAKAYGGQNASDIMRMVADNPLAEDSGIDSRAVRTSLRQGARDEEFYYSRQLRRAINILNNTRQRYKAADTPEEKAIFDADPNNAKKLAALKTLESAKKVYYGELDKIRAANISIQGKRDRKKLADSALRRAVESAQAVIDSTE